FDELRPPSRTAPPIRGVSFRSCLGWMTIQVADKPASGSWFEEESRLPFNIGGDPKWTLSTPRWPATPVLSSQTATRRRQRSGHTAAKYRMAFALPSRRASPRRSSDKEGRFLTNRGSGAGVRLTDALRHGGEGHPREYRRPT